MGKSILRSGAAIVAFGLTLSTGCSRHDQPTGPPNADSPAAIESESGTGGSRVRSRGPAEGPVPGEPAFDTHGERYALLIGVRGYGKLSGLRPLQYSENDVTELAQVLLEHGYRPENVVLMTDSQGAGKPDLLPEREKILHQLQALLRDRGKADTVLIAVAGHGVQFKGDEDSFFCPMDAEVENRETLISMGDVYGQLKDCPASFKVLLCDACRDDPFPGNSRGIRLTIPAQQSELPLPGGVAVFYSCSPGEVAYEDRDLQHGVFFSFIIDGLRGRADLDGDGEVMLPELEYHTKRRVSDYVRAEIGGRRQMPNLKGNLLGLVPLAQKKAAPPGTSPATATGRSEVTPAAENPNPPAGSATDVVRNSPLLSLPLMNKTTGEIRRFEEMGWGIASLAFSPDCRWLAAGKSDEALLLFDLVEGAQADVRSDLESLGEVTCVTFSPDGTRLLTGGYDGRILIWDVSPTGHLKEVGQYVGQTGKVECATVSQDGRMVLSGGMDQKLHYWELSTGRVVKMFAGFQNGLRAVRFADQQTALATDGTVLQHINLDTAEVLRVYQLNRGGCHAADFSPDGKVLVISSGYDLLLWNTQTGGPLGTCDGNEIQWSACFTPDGKRLISGANGVINVWDVATAIRTHQTDLKTKWAYVQAIAVANDCQHVAAIGASAGQDLQVFRIPPPP